VEVFKTSLVSKFLAILKQVIHKRRPQSGGFVQCGRFADTDAGSSDVDSALFGAKTSNFSKLYPQARTRSLSLCGHFALRARMCGQGERGSILCGRLLWTAPKTSKCVSTQFAFKNNLILFKIS